MSFQLPYYFPWKRFGRRRSRDAKFCDSHRNSVCRLSTANYLITLVAGDANTLFNLITLFASMSAMTANKLIRFVSYTRLIATKVIRFSFRNDGKMSGLPLPLGE